MILPSLKLSKNDQKSWKSIETLEKVNCRKCRCLVSGSGAATAGIAWEHGGFTHVIETEVEKNDALEANAGAAVWRHTAAHRVDVHLQ